MALANSQLFPNEEDVRSIRLWWHSLLREHGKYPSYAFFLFLSSDKNIPSYLSEYGRELDFVSGHNCLVLVFNKNKFRRSGIDESLRQIEGGLNFFYWKELIKEAEKEGYSVQIANYFDIPYTAFPCLVIFQDIRSPEHILIPLSGKEVNEIANEIKTIFSVIQKAVSEENSVLTELYNFYQKETSRIGNLRLINSIRGIAGKSFETAVEVWLKSLIK